MPDEHSCVLCRDRVGARSINRICQHDVCDLCRLGDVAGRVAERGWTVSAEERFLGGSGRRFSRIHVTGRLPRPIVIRASFRREARFALDVRLMKLFGRELRVGDPLFDDRVFIRTTTPDDTAAFLRPYSVQAAIQEILWQDPGEPNLIEIRDGRLEVLADCSPDFAQDGRVFSCILLHHLEGFMAPETGERGPYRSAPRPACQERRLAPLHVITSSATAR